MSCHYCNCSREPASTLTARKVVNFLLAVFFMLILGTVIFKSFAHAATSDYVKRGQCLPSYPFKMWVTAKADTKTYLVGQAGGGLASVGAVQMTNHQSFSGERLNILVEYLGTKSMRGSDGFEREVDVWRQCSKIKTAAQ